MKRFLPASLLATALVLITGGCGDAFLDLTPPSSPTVGQLYQNDRDFRGAMMGTYDALQETYRELWQLTELRADNGDHRWTGWPPLVAIDQFVVNTSDDILNNTWLRLFRGVSRANLVLEKLATADPAAVPSAAVFRSEAHFLRALCYFHLTMLWGDVPLTLTSVSLEESYRVSRTPQTQVFEQVVRDLQEAEKALPTAWTGAEQGRATKGAAQALLGRVYLVQRNWAGAEGKLKEVVGAGSYALLPDYRDVFSHTNKRHREYIFDIEYVDGGIGEGSDFPVRFIPNHAQLRTNYAINGVSGETLSPTDEYMALFEPADKRIPITFATTFRNAAGQDVRANTPYTLKYLAPMPIQNDSRVNWKVIRYADVLLMLAEALNEQGKTAEGLPLLNQVRSRAGVSSLTALSQTAAREAIARERRMELGFEGHRWYDLVRTGRVVAELQAKGYPIRDFMRLYAIPQQQVDIVNNSEVLPQNPGY
jgi:hypothetical protein